MTKLNSQCVAVHTAMPIPLIRRPKISEQMIHGKPAYEKQKPTAKM